MSEKVNLMEIVKKTLSRYLDLELDPKWLIIKDDKSGKEIDFEWFIEHLQEDYDEKCNEG